MNFHYSTVKPRCFSPLLLTLAIFSYFLTNAQTLPPKREFRGVWIATINNIDWPSSKNLTPHEQRQEFSALLDYHKKCGINAVFVQIRPASDAFFPSEFEPWSKWLTGKQGQPPRPLYDPLKFMIREAHKRNMEFHAWVNPFRARGSTSATHITRKQPQWFFQYGPTKYFNPGLPEVREYLVRLLADIALRYEIDGIHFDDYFYPYPDHGPNLPDSWTYYNNKNGFDNIADWRRNNINLFIESVHEMLQAINPKVKFGVSPFGVWRNKRMDFRGSKTTSGYTSYDHLFADVRQWLQKGWIDYVAPQVYQSTRHRSIPFKPLVKWWSENSFGRQVYIGHACYRFFNTTSDRAWYSRTELSEQIQYTRSTPKLNGSILYSSNSLLKNQGNFADTLRENYYALPALIPTMLWKDSIPPLAPLNVKLEFTLEGNKLSWKAPKRAKDDDLAQSFILYRFHKFENLNFENPYKIITHLHKTETQFLDTDIVNNDHYRYFITALDKHHNESPPLEIRETNLAPPVAWQLPFSQETSALLSDLLVQQCQAFINFENIGLSGGKASNLVTEE